MAPIRTYMIHILIAEDNKIVREGTVELLNHQEDMTVIGEAANGIEALQLLQAGIIPDIVLADMNMPEMDGISLTENVIVKFPAVKVAILTMHDKETFIIKALDAGAKGYILKDGDFEALFTAIRTIAAGGSFVTKIN